MITSKYPSGIEFDNFIHWSLEKKRSFLKVNDNFYFEEKTENDKGYSKVEIRYKVYRNGFIKCNRNVIDKVVLHRGKLCQVISKKFTTIKDPAYVRSSYAHLVNNLYQVDALDIPSNYFLLSIKNLQKLTTKNCYLTEMFPNILTDKKEFSWLGAFFLEEINKWASYPIQLGDVNVTDHRYWKGYKIIPKNKVKEFLASCSTYYYSMDMLLKDLLDFYPISKIQNERSASIYNQHLIGEDLEEFTDIEFENLLLVKDSSLFDKLLKGKRPTFTQVELMCATLESINDYNPPF